MKMTKSDPAVSLHFYQSGETGTVLFQMHDPCQLKSLRRVFEGLAEGTAKSVSIKASGIVSLFVGIEDLMLALHHKDKEPSCSVKKIVENLTRPVFRFERPREGWLECAELLDGLKRPGHQYLSRGSADKAVIVISYQENLGSPQP